MEFCRVEDTNRTKINFKIPMKTNQKVNENCGNSQSSEIYQSPLKLDQQPEPNYVEDKQLNHGTSKMETLKEISSEQKQFKRKINSNMPLYAGRNPLYPEELNNLILPLFCKLCNAALNSAKSAHFHYLSKSHEKKVNTWLADWSKRTGEPAPKINKEEHTLSKESSVLFCQCCNVKLTSLQDAKQHYSGKKHASKVNSGVSLLEQNNVGVLPKNIGKQKLDRRFGIGDSFKIIESVQSETIHSETVQSEIVQTETKQNLYCEICDIYTTSEQQLAIHFQGTKHFKKLKEICPEKAFAERDSQLSRAILNCRTPSGQFYCKTCNITVPDDKIFSQHLVSKRHAKNLKKQQPNQSEATQ